MPLFPSPYAGPGGLLWFEYGAPSAGERHQIRLHVAHFNANPIGAANDYSYDATGCVVPDERSVLETAAAFAAVWAPYYPPDWSISIYKLYYNSGGQLLPLPATPQMAAVSGTYSNGSGASGSAKRIFRLISVQGWRRRLWLLQLPSSLDGADQDVSTAAGGIDGRDQALIAYLSGATAPSTGLVAPDGQRYQEAASVYQMLARPVEAVPTTGSGAALFVQASRPAAQGAALWVDTSSGVAPYPLLAYDAATGSWLDVGGNLVSG